MSHLNYQLAFIVMKRIQILRLALAISVLFIPQNVLAQRTVNGKVTEAGTDEGIPGATIQIKGTTKGTVTDFDGNFSLQVTDNDILIISFVGYLTKEVNVKEEPFLAISLNVDIEELEEVVVIGYGKVEEKDVTGVVSKIDAETFNKGMFASPEALINGKVAGLSMTSSGGEPGAQLNIRIRGGTSLSASNQPLFVVDGVPLDSEPNNPSGMAGARNPLNFINSSDIADITVLKDASAAAIYGSRGANGVIIITTKSGSSSKPEFSYDGSFTMTTFSDPGDFLSTEEFIYTIETKAPGKLSELGNSDTDWVDEVTRMSYGTNHNLSASFGNKSTKVRISGNYLLLNGILETSKSERIAGSINATQKLLNDDLTITLNTKHSANDDRFAPVVMNTAFAFDPTQSVTIDDPTYGGYYEHENPLAPTNPVSTIYQTYDIGKSYRNLLSLKLDYSIPFIEGLSVKTNTSIDITEGKRQLWQPETLKSNSNPNGQFIYAKDNSTSRLAEVYLNYTKFLEASDLQMDYTAGYSYQDWEKYRPRKELMDTVVSSTLGIDPEKVISNSELDNISSRLNDINSEADTLESRLISFWGRANFSFKDRYILTATLRRDGSTRFAPANQWGNFPSLALGWRVMEESFAQPLKSIFSDLKLRYSWGITGSQEIPDYLWSTTYAQSQVGAKVILGDEVITTLRPTAVDPNIKWEQTTSSNIGIDFGILGGRLFGSLDYYKKTTDDLIMEIPAPAGSVPGDLVYKNVGSMDNTGFEVLLNATAIDKNDWRLNFNFNASTNRNKVTKITEGDGQLLRGTISGAGFGSRIQVLRVGHPAYSFYVYEHILDDNGNPRGDGFDYNGDGFINDLDIYVDQLTLDTTGDGIPDSSDGVINENDRVIQGKPWPDWSFGLTSNVGYKKFDLSFTFRAQVGAYTYNNIAAAYGAYKVADGIAPTNIHRSAYSNDFRYQQVFSNVYVENANFVRLDNVSLGYRHDVSDRMNIRAYFTASNLLLITGYSGVDPEAGPPPTSNQEERNSFGIDNNLYPRGRTFIIGFNINFK